MGAKLSIRCFVLKNTKVNKNFVSLLISFVEKLKQKYPNGYVTKNQVFEKSDSTSSYKSLTTVLLKRIFAATDLDNSGEISGHENFENSLYEVENLSVNYKLVA